MTGFYRKPILRMIRYRFLFEELVKRDFKKKYKGTLLGVGWSLLSPLLMLAMMRLVFTQFFGRTVEHYTTYLFCGLLMFGFFSESTKGGMKSIAGGAGIFSKVNVPKYMFLLARNVQTLFNFLLTLVVFLVFCWLDGVAFTWRFLLLVYPILTLFAFGLGLGFLLATMYVFFRDLEYLWSVAMRLVMYGSAIFYTTDSFGPGMKLLFRCNIVYDHIEYARLAVLGGTVPGWELHAILAGAALVSLALGGFVYRRFNREFIYHV